MATKIQSPMRTWIEFVEGPPSKSGKTKTWEVYPIGNRRDLIGRVLWYAPWRKYAFEALPSAIWEQNCLRTIADFIVEQTKLHKAK